MFQKCLVSGESLRNNTPTSYDLSNGDINFDILFSNRGAWTLQIIWANLDDTDAVVSVLGSNDNENFDAFYGTSTKTLDTASGSHTFRAEDFDFEYFRGAIAVNSVTSGTIKLILTVKPINNAY